MKKKHGGLGKHLGTKPTGMDDYGHKGGSEGRGASSHQPLDVHGRTKEMAKRFSGGGKRGGRKRS